MFVYFLLLVLMSLQAYKGDQCFDADVIIIGGGISGLTALSKLIQNGLTSVLLLEGRSEIGGRLYKYDLGNVTVELGANWVHGIHRNPVTELVEGSDLRGQIENPMSFVCRDSSGFNWTPQFTSEQTKLKYLFQEMLKKSADKSWRNKHWDFKKQIYKSIRNALESEGWSNDTVIRNIAEVSILDFQDAVPPELVSARTVFKSPGNVKSLTDEQIFVTDQRGYVSILQELFDGNGIPWKHISLNKTINKIYWNKKGVRVTATDGSAYTSRTALITVSVGVLQKTDLFRPPLPGWKMTAINSCPMAVYTKIFLKFPFTFWDNVEYIYHADIRRGYYPVWQSLDAKMRMGFVSNVLLITVTGSESERVESMSDQDVLNEIMTVLKGVYGDQIPWPSHYIVPRWGKDPYFYGSYSFYAPRQTHQMFLDMQSNVGPLFFAGEALHETYQGYLHGAYCIAESAAFDVHWFLNSASNSHFNDNSNAAYFDNCFRDSCGGCFRY